MLQAGDALARQAQAGEDDRSLVTALPGAPLARAVLRFGFFFFRFGGGGFFAFSFGSFATFFGFFAFFSRFFAFAFFTFSGGRFTAQRYCEPIPTRR